MECKCKCGTATTLDNLQSDSGSFTCPACGQTQVVKQSAHPRPLLAGLLAILAPGLGHIYAGSLKYALAMFVSTILMWNFLFSVLIRWEAAPFNVLLGPLLALAIHTFAFVTAFRLAKHYHRLLDKPRRPRNLLWYIALYALLILAAINLIPELFRYRNFVNPSSSMETTMMVGDYFLVDEAAYRETAPARGDLIMFLYPTDGKTLYVKRCVAIGADTVLITDKKLFVNRRLIPLPQSSRPADSTVVPKRDNFGPYVVPVDNFFVLGDNRDESFDSRFWGPVPRDNIVGRPVKIVFSRELGRIGLPLK